MTREFVKFPRTPHLLWPLSHAPKDDRVLAPDGVRELLSGVVVVEEKIDGANLGLSLDEDGQIRVQNRGSWVERGAHPQFQPVWAWISKRRFALEAALQGDRIIYGEWCFAVHAVHYDRLPDWFLGFDVYDLNRKRFWSTRRRDESLEAASVCTVPRVFEGHVTLGDLQKMLQSEPSRVGDGPIEGLYIRRESADWLDVRAKLVRPEFLLAIDDHWSARQLERNSLALS